MEWTEAEAREALRIYLWQRGIDMPPDWWWCPIDGGFIIEAGVRVKIRVNERGGFEAPVSGQ